MRFLNVGGATKQAQVPDCFDDWEQVLLDIDPKVNPDICLDARELVTLTEKFNGIYCSHVLEHFYWHEIPLLLRGFLHVLNPKGFVFIRVPDIAEVVQQIAKRNLDLTDQLYMSAAGSISPLDVLYGYQKQIEQSGEGYYAHKTGFSYQMMQSSLEQAGFVNIEIATVNLEIVAKAYKK